MNRIGMTLVGWVATSVLVWADDAGRSSLYHLARTYESVVEQFEQSVLRTRGIHRADEKWVDRLDDASARFRQAAKISSHRNRLLYRWKEVQKLQQEVEQRIFGKYTPNKELIWGWDRVLSCADAFAQELFIHIENPQHIGNVRRIARSNAWRSRFLSSALPRPPLQAPALPLPASQSQ